MRIMKTLDWTRLLGFDQVSQGDERRLGSKVGAKQGVAKDLTSLGAKIGAKAGIKV